MWLTLQQGSSDDYAISTDEIYPVKDLLEEAFAGTGARAALRGIGASICAVEGVGGQQEHPMAAEKYLV